MKSNFVTVVITLIVALVVCLYCDVIHRDQVVEAVETLLDLVQPERRTLFGRNGVFDWFQR